jgi:microcin C transport system substrate-binding protein
MAPYVRQAYWRWWRLPKVPGTKHTGNLFSVFDDSNGGLFWYDERLHKETKQAMKKKKPFDPVTIIDRTYKTN